MNSEGSISIWFFIGVSLLVNGVLILGAGLYAVVHPPEHPVVLFQLHADVWWGAVLAIVGAVYTIHFRPGKSRR
jgi:hypothetical protein